MKKLLVFLLLLISTFTIYLANNTKEVVAATRTQDANGNWYWGYQSQLDESYYSNLSGITDKTLFENTLQKIISANYTELGYDNDRYPGMKAGDEDPNNPNNVLCLYTGVSLSKNASHSTVWNTEHVWAKSHGFPDEGDMPHSDLHHLRVTQNSINSTRGNKGFKDLNGSGSTDGYGNYWSGNWFEPRDCVKGDVARMMMYMDVRYNGDSKTCDSVKLTLVDGDTGGSDPAFGDLATLKKWHVQDPVDDFERRRNDEIQKAQGNRNPFIDHPEYADIIYNTKYAETNSGNTPSTPTTYKVTYVATGAQFNYTDSTNYSKGDKIKEPNTDPIVNGKTFVGWYKDSNCTTKWNFNTDTISSNVTLYAKFVVNTSQTFDEVFKNLSIKTQLLFNVDEVVSDSVAVTNTVTISKFTASGSQMGATDHNLADYMEFDTTLFDIYYNHNGSQLSHINSDIRLYNAGGNGNSIDITAKNGITIKEVSCSSSGLKITISSDGKSAKIHNTNSTSSGNVSVKNFTIKYETSGSGISYKIENGSLQLNYVLQLSEGDYNLYQSSGKNLELKVNDQIANYKVLKVNGEYRIIFSVAITDVNTVYTPVFTYNGLKLNRTGFSAKTLAQFYLSNYLSTNSLVKQYASCLNEIIG